MRWTGAEIGYLIEHWNDEDTSLSDMAANMAAATGFPLRTQKALKVRGYDVLKLGARPRQMSWPRRFESEIKRLLLVEGLSLRQAGDALGKTKNAIASAKYKLGLCEPRPKAAASPSIHAPSQPRTNWASRPFPGVVL